jgi:hypothetical protein
MLRDELTLRPARGLHTAGNWVPPCGMLCAPSPAAVRQLSFHRLTACRRRRKGPTGLARGARRAGQISVWQWHWRSPAEFWGNVGASRSFATAAASPPPPTAAAYHDAPWPYACTGPPARPLLSSPRLHSSRVAVCCPRTCRRLMASVIPPPQSPIGHR